jgi:tRNA 2-thiouridine synthesizing protein A
MAEIEISKTLDARGSFCPGPLMELIKGMKKSQVGDVIEVLSSDKGSANDIPEWVNKMKHELVYSKSEDGFFRIAVRKMR